MSLHPSLPALPARIRRLPVDARGYPVPWFVQWFRADGSAVEGSARPGDYPDFRVSDTRKMHLAWKEKRCWVCGDLTGQYLAFVIGPMCAINRISSEPPSHRECAIFAAKACPFLTKPLVVRREENLPGGIIAAAGTMIARNPGVALVWITKSYAVQHVDARYHEGKVVANRGVLFEIGEPTETLWYCEGRLATREQVLESMKSGLPRLLEVAKLEGSENEVHQSYKEALRLVPA